MIRTGKNYKQANWIAITWQFVLPKALLFVNIVNIQNRNGQQDASPSYSIKSQQNNSSLEWTDWKMINDYEKCINAFYWMVKYFIIVEIILYPKYIHSSIDIQMATKERRNVQVSNHVNGIQVGQRSKITSKRKRNHMHVNLFVKNRLFSHRNTRDNLWLTPINTIWKWTMRCLC